LEDEKRFHTAWVISGSGDFPSPCPVYPRTQTHADGSGCMRGDSKKAAAASRNLFGFGALPINAIMRSKEDPLDETTIVDRICYLRFCTCPHPFCVSHAHCDSEYHRQFRWSSHPG
jgi:hypothetical protein